MNGGPLGRVVGKVALAVDHDSAHAGDDNHGRGARGVIRGRDSGLEKRQEGDGGEIDGCDVGVEYRGPGRGLFAVPQRISELLGGR